MTDQLHANTTVRPTERRTSDVNFWVNRPLGFTRRVRQGIQTTRHASTAAHR
jgi:hypothetical protein